MTLPRLFIVEPFDPRRGVVRLFDPLSADVTAKRDVLYKALPPGFDLHAYERVKTIEKCDFVVLPQAVREITPAWQTYFDEWRSRARAAGKEVIIWIGRDDSHRRHVEGAIVCKGSDYTHAIHDNEFIPAPFVEDLGYGREFVPRRKGERPVVSFCGYAGFPSWRNYVRYLVKNATLDVTALLTRNADYLVYKRGIYFRRKAMQYLAADQRIDTRFIVRSSFSANRGTLEGSVDTRTEYIANMLDSDFVLAPKGDANFSSRFYEALSLGKVPILIDTNMPMPLSQEIDYDTFTIRVPHAELSLIGDILSKKFASLTDESYATMQREARKVFREYLRFDAYWNYALQCLKERGISALR
jgi:hypothetical protein